MFSWWVAFFSHTLLHLLHLFLWDLLLSNAQQHREWKYSLFFSETGQNYIVLSILLKYITYHSVPYSSVTFCVAVSSSSHSALICLQGRARPTSGHLPEKRALSEDVLHLHPRVRQECGHTGRAEQKEPSVWRSRTGVWGNDGCLTCFLCLWGRVFWASVVGLFIHVWRMCFWICSRKLCHLKDVSLCFLFFCLSKASPRCANLALRHYLLKPVQRIPQYQLLLTGIQNYITFILTLMFWHSVDKSVGS